MQELHRAFLDFDDRAIVTENIWGYLWGKLGYGSQLFATALTNDSIADALADPRPRSRHPHPPALEEEVHDRGRVEGEELAQHEAPDDAHPERTP